MWEACGEVDGESLGQAGRGTRPGTQGWVHIRMVIVAGGCCADLIPLAASTGALLTLGRPQNATASL